MIYSIGEDIPQIDDTAFVAPSADIMGKVVLKEQSSVWFNAVIRGDCDIIEVGKRSNVQDGAVLHADPGQPMKIGEDVTIGHQAMVHCREIGDRTLIGIQAVVLDGAIVGSDCLIGANALVKAGSVIPDGSMVVGSPAKVIRKTDENMRLAMLAGATVYVQKAAHMASDLIEIKR